MWLNRKLTFKKHTEMKCAAATRAFHSIYRLSNTLKGLSFQAIRQLYISCVEVIEAYGVPCWWNHNYARIKGFYYYSSSSSISACSPRAGTNNIHVCAPLLGKQKRGSDCRKTNRG
jgi:hypothetical protein